MGKNCAPKIFAEKNLVCNVASRLPVDVVFHSAWHLVKGLSEYHTIINIYNNVSSFISQYLKNLKFYKE